MDYEHHEYYERQRQLAQLFVRLAGEAMRTLEMRTEVSVLDIRAHDRFKCEIVVFLHDDTKVGELTISANIKSNLLKKIR